jgi:hypothetical protein
MPGTRHLTPADIQGIAASWRNALAPRGGVAFDGTAGNRFYTTLTNQNIGTDDFSVVMAVQIPHVLDGTMFKGLWALASAQSGALNIANAVNAWLGSNNRLMVEFYGASSSDRSNAEVNVGSLLGKTVFLAFTRSGSTFKVYINGVEVVPTFSTNGTAPGFGLNITSTFFTVGSRNSNTANSLDSRVHAASLYNLTLSPADVQEIYELGGAVPERFKFGSQVARYVSDFSAGADGWIQNIGDSNLLATGNVDGVLGVDDTLSIEAVGANKIFQLRASNATLSPGRKYRVTFDYYAESGAFNAGVATYLGTGAQGGRWDTDGGVLVVEGSWQSSKSIDFISNASNSAMLLAGFSDATRRFTSRTWC